MRFALLGPVEIYGDRDQLITVSAGKQRIVLAALLLQANRVVSVDALIELLWDGPAPPSARASLVNYVARLRRALGPGPAVRLQTTAGGYRLRIDDEAEADHLLAPMLEARALDRAKAADWPNADLLAGQALSLWRGDPLRDVPSDSLHLQYADGLHGLHSRLMELRADALLHRSHYDLALPLFSELIEQHPLREPLYERAFLAWYASGQRAQALSLFQSVRVLLRDELGVQPSATMRELHRLALRDASVEELTGALTGSGGFTGPTPRSAGPVTDRPSDVRRTLRHQLPAAPGTIIGRDAELSALTDALTGSGAARAAVALLVGTAGVGKTTLALAWSHRNEHAFPDGRLYLDLNGFAAAGAPVPAEAAVRILLDCLGLPAERLPATAEGRLALYRGMTTGKRLLLVLDNARDADQIRPLLPPGDSCRTLITSRHNLTSLAAREGAALVAVAPLTADEARELLTARLGPERTDGQDETIARIAERCAHLPLALVVAAARAESLAEAPLDALAAQMDADRGRLRLLDGGDATSNVRAVLSWSYRQLSAPAARLFRLLGMHPGPDFSALAAASTAGVDRSAAASALAELATMNLITEHRPQRYSMHSLLRDLAAELVEDCEDPAARVSAHRRLLDHYLHTAIEANRGTVTYAGTVTRPVPPDVQIETFPDTAVRAAWFAAERTVLAATINDAAARGSHDYVWQLVYAQSVSLSLIGRWREDVEFCTLALASARHIGDPVAQAHMHRLLGRSLARLGETHASLAHLRDAEGLYREAGDLAGLGENHRTQGNVYAVAGDFTSAVQHLRRFLVYVRESCDRQGEASALNMMGWLLAQAGQFDQALDYCQTAAKLFAECSEQGHQSGHVWDSLGFIQFKRGDLAAAAEAYEAATAWFVKVGDDYQQALAVSRLGDVQAAADDHAAARASWRLALGIFRALERAEAGEVLAKLEPCDRAAEQ